MNQEPPILQGGEDVTIATISNSFGNIFFRVFMVFRDS